MPCTQPTKCSSSGSVRPAVMASCAHMRLLPSSCTTSLACCGSAPSLRALGRNCKCAGAVLDVWAHLRVCVCACACVGGCTARPKALSCPRAPNPALRAQLGHQREEAVQVGAQLESDGRGPLDTQPARRHRVLRLRRIALGHAALRRQKRLVRVLSFARGGGWSRAPASSAVPASFACAPALQELARYLRSTAQQLIASSTASTHACYAA